MNLAISASNGAENLRSNWLHGMSHLQVYMLCHHQLTACNWTPMQSTLSQQVGSPLLWIQDTDSGILEWLKVLADGMYTNEARQVGWMQLPFATHICF